MAAKKVTEKEHSAGVSKESAPGFEVRKSNPVTKALKVIAGLILIAIVIVAGVWLWQYVWPTIVTGALLFVLMIGLAVVLASLSD
jgi:fatty acid desaturase